MAIAAVVGLSAGLLLLMLGQHLLVLGLCIAGLVGLGLVALARRA